MRSYTEKCSRIWLRKNFVSWLLFNILAKPVYKGKERDDDIYDDSESHFSAVDNFICSNVLENHEAVSMRTLKSLYNVKQGNDRRFGHKLTMKLKNRYWFFN